MEWGIREIVALLVLLVLAGIAVYLLINYQRSQRGRIKSRVKYNFDEPAPADEGRPDYGSELPRGGARVVGYRDPDDIKTVHQRIRQQAEASRPRLSIFREKPEQTSLGLDQEAEVPMLLDPAGMDAEEALQAMESEEALHTPDPDTPLYDMEPEEPVRAMLPEEPLRAIEPEEEPDPLFMERIRAEDYPEELARWQEARQPREPASAAAVPEEEAEPPRAARTRARPQPKPAPEPKPEPEPRFEPAPEPRLAPEIPAAVEPEPEPELGEPEDDGPLEVLVVNLIAAPGTMLGGAAIDRALKDEGLRFGQMDIYHYTPDGHRTRAWFSVANILNPGTFSQAALADFATPGLCFFMTLAASGENQDRFATLLEISDRVAKQLGARLHDEQRSVMTRQTIEHYRSRIRDYERRRMLR